MMHEGTNGEAGFLRPLINAYSSLPLHGITAIPGKVSGALMVAEAIVDAVPLIHGPIGCSFQRKINPFRPYMPFYETPCTDMNDLEVVYGGEDKLRVGIKETFEKYHPNLILVITTCASDLIGDDFKVVIEKTKAKGDVGCEVVYTTGDFTDKSKPVGYQDALYAITDQMLCNGVESERTDKNDGSVNIITFPIHGAGLKTEEMASMLNEMGIEINKVCFDHTAVKDLQELSKAELNITDFPMAWAKRMKEKMGVDYFSTVQLEEYQNSEDAELLSPYGIEGSVRVFKEIAKRMGKEGEAEEVIEQRKKHMTERLYKARKGVEGKKVAYNGMGGLHSLELMLLQDMGMKASVIIYNTRGLERLLSESAIQEVLNISVAWAREYGSDPEVLVNPTAAEEIKAMKRTGTDLAVLSSLTNPVHEYNKEGIRTFNPMDFMLHHQRVGFECAIELAMLLKEALNKPKTRNPLLCMLEYDPYRTSMIPQWAKLADMFAIIREGAIGDRCEI
ncbi:Light-independent protochlorophyllide reductase subunit B [ANME-1 cluster archaeon GoMg1]|nr:Light-independent protochlorophyllide reductase subunit B [ANME-1 cluster archaeon GoMg1]